jgi:hypothetical protein
VLRSHKGSMPSAIAPLARGRVNPPITVEQLCQQMLRFILLLSAFHSFYRAFPLLSRMTMIVGLT